MTDHWYPFYTPGWRERERETGRLKCLTQEHSTVTLQGLARLQERIAKMKAKIVNKALNGTEWHAAALSL